VGVRLQRPQGQAKRCHLTVACRRPHLEIGQGWLPSRSCFLSVQCHGLRARDFTKLCRPSPVILSKGASEASAVSEGSRRQKLQSTPYQAAIRSFAALRTTGKFAMATSCRLGGVGTVCAIVDDDAFRCGHVRQSADDVCLIIIRRLPVSDDVDCLAVSSSRLV
jgi:hypothetical protein